MASDKPAAPPKRELPDGWELLDFDNSRIVCAITDGIREVTIAENGELTTFVGELPDPGVPYAAATYLLGVFDGD
jgi:hypothetical protein